MRWFWWGAKPTTNKESDQRDSSKEAHRTRTKGGRSGYAQRLRVGRGHTPTLAAPSSSSVPRHRVVSLAKKRTHKCCELATFFGQTTHGIGVGQERVRWCGMEAEGCGRMQQQTTSQQHPTQHTYLFGWPIDVSKLVSVPLPRLCALFTTLPCWWRCL